VTLQVAQARAGEMEQAIQRDAFMTGHELSLPMALPPAWKGAPGRVVGRVCLGPAEVECFRLLRRLFPGLTGWVLGHKSGGAGLPDVRGLCWVDPGASLEKVAQIVATSTLILDVGGSLPSGVDRLAAAFATPYLGDSPYWPRVSPENRSPVRHARHLLLDQGAAADLCDEARGRFLVMEGTRSLKLLQEQVPQNGVLAQAAAQER
jgi:hypothetical protein